jgi:hypothetical protein
MDNFFKKIIKEIAQELDSGNDFFTILKPLK